MPKVKKQELSFYIKKFYEYILLEKNFSNKTVEAYIHDIKALEDFLKDKNIETATSEDIQLFLIFFLRKIFRYVRKLVYFPGLNHFIAICFTKVWFLTTLPA